MGPRVPAPTAGPATQPRAALVVQQARLLPPSLARFRRLEAGTHLAQRRLKAIGQQWGRIFLDSQCHLLLSSTVGQQVPRRPKKMVRPLLHLQDNSIKRRGLCHLGLLLAVQIHNHLDAAYHLGRTELSKAHHL